MALALDPRKSWLRPVFWWALVLLYVAGVIVAAARSEFSGAATRALLRRLFPDLALAAVQAISFYGRKVLHAVSYAALAIVLANAVGSMGGAARSRPRWTTMLAAVSLALAIALFDEAWQSRFPWRTALLTDVGVDLGGALAGLLLRCSYAGRRGRRQARAT